MTHIGTLGACEGGPEFEPGWGCSFGGSPAVKDLRMSKKVSLKNENIIIKKLVQKSRMKIFFDQVNLVGMTHTRTLGACEGGLEFEP